MHSTQRAMESCWDPRRRVYRGVQRGRASARGWLILEAPLEQVTMPGWPLPLGAALVSQPCACLRALGSRACP